MTDIVERLRKWSTPIPGVDESMTGDMMLMADAADEIERLRAALRCWCNAYRSGQHEPLVVAYESTVAKFPALEERT